MVAVVIILITILFISIIIYPNIFILHVSNVFLCSAFIFLLDFHRYFDWIRIYWCTWLDVVMELQEIYIQVFRLMFQTDSWWERKSTICSPWIVQEGMGSNWKNTKYFPTMISKSFVQYCFYGGVSNTELLSSFLNYVSRNERILIEKLLSDEANNDHFLGDEFLDFLDQFKWRTKVSK